MKKKIVVVLMLISSSVFANNTALIEEIQDIKVEIQAESQPIGKEAYIKFGSDNNASRAYIAKECQDVLVNFDYLESKDVVDYIVYPNCLEFAIEAMNKE